ncbi:Uncharacterized protein Adt_39267 [Abeliophyllum distichum]|uniref:Uncharacterized protein n=1 Tax=Abeliophyllum distichum TaxID=126358 RepID=A0ABD1Q8U1_9LAMI
MGEINLVDQISRRDRNHQIRQSNCRFGARSGVAGDLPSPWWRPVDLHSWRLHRSLCSCHVTGVGRANIGSTRLVRRCKDQALICCAPSSAPDLRVRSARSTRPDPRAAVVSSPVDFLCFEPRW